MNANFKPITGPEVCEFCIIQGGGGFQNVVLILLVMGSMMEGANPIGHIGINMPSQKSKI